MSTMSRQILHVLAGGLIFAMVSTVPRALAQPAQSASVLPTGGGQALIDTVRHGPAAA